jgi:NAD(P)-dependent dehydrogenase (short-subunit alcohol dehydrogenase family)
MAKDIEDRPGEREEATDRAAQTGAKPKNPLPRQKQARPGIEKKVTPRPQYRAPKYKGSGKLKNLAAIITGGDAKETIAAVEAEGRKCIAIAGDVKDPKFCQKAVEKARKEFGRLDILVNNAAFQKHQKTIEDISDEQFEETFRTNIFGYFYMAKAALKHIPEGGSIINCGSITGLEGSKELIDYSATKGAIHAFTKSLAQSLAERKIRVNCVSPGPVWTPLNVADKEPEEVAKHGADTPMKRPGQPEEIAPAFVFFASNADSSYISGEVMTILGGETRAG